MGDIVLTFEEAFQPCFSLRYASTLYAVEALFFQWPGRLLTFWTDYKVCVAVDKDGQNRA